MSREWVIYGVGVAVAGILAGIAVAVREEPEYRADRAMSVLGEELP